MKIRLDHKWTYRTPEMTVTYPAGEHEVFKYVAEAAAADGAIPKEAVSGDSDKPAAPRKTSAS